MKYSWKSPKSQLRYGGYLAIFVAGAITSNLNEITSDHILGFFVMVGCLLLLIGGMGIVDSQGIAKQNG